EHLYRAPSIESVTSQGIVIAENDRDGAIGYRRTHGKRQWIGDWRRCEHLLRSHRLPVLRSLVVDRVRMVLGRNDSKLALRYSGESHQLPAVSGVDIHEAAVRFGRHGALGHF